ncbi:hypothetical protein [Pseudomonas sp. HS6]|jgi:hypothetical protein|uniref:hypothetical protein n=1 Tax=Pseudomonas sp. HS6 TaxID=2850559 RepID=UPI002019ECC8|nr:hypothetical protein [Pseudomonas sp. HS6]UQS13386.1 hypothetical protein JJN09_19455 [Pseudomonas sp. HS6]
MKNIALLIGLAFSSCVLATEEKKVATDVYKADTAMVAGKLVRYYQTFASPCVMVQILKPGGGGEASNSRKFCNISGKNFSDDFSEVVLERGEFSKEDLSLTMKLMPLTEGADVIEVCSFKVEGEVLGEPKCNIK